jgi:prolipoprotein diacylglyceryltransferase
MGVPRPGPKLREYTTAILVAVVADLLIVAAGAARGSQEYTGLMFMLEAAVLGLVFGARLAVVATLTPLVAYGVLIFSSAAVGTEGWDTEQAADYLFVAVLVASAAGLVGLLRDRYFPRAA